MQSTINVYEGYSPTVANGYARSSVYVPVDDGCRIAIDILRPALDGALLDGPRPTVVQATGYRRAYYKKENEFNAPKYAKLTAHLPVGALITAYEQRPACKLVIDHGYNVVSIDFRGTGASFGTHANQTWRNAADIAQIIDWIAGQDWATDRVGMIGGSWEGAIQLATAVYQPKHLTCIVPQIPPSVLNALFDGGLAMSGFTNDWSEMRKGQDGADLAAPVDGPDGEGLFAEALAERAPQYAGSDDPSVLEHLTRNQYVGSATRGAPPPPFPELGPLGDVFDEFARIGRSGTAVYLQTGWWDMAFAGECLDLYEALDGPKRIIVGPWNHGVLPTMEPLRWFDYWLRDVDNGIADEPGLIFATTDLAGRAVWKGADGWPLPEVESDTWHLSDTATGTIDSALDGGLERNAGPEDHGALRRGLRRRTRQPRPHALHAAGRIHPASRPRGPRQALRDLHDAGTRGGRGTHGRADALPRTRDDRLRRRHPRDVGAGRPRRRRGVRHGRLAEPPPPQGEHEPATAPRRRLAFAGGGGLVAGASRGTHDRGVGVVSGVGVAPRRVSATVDHRRHGPRQPVRAGTRPRSRPDVLPGWRLRFPAGAPGGEGRQAPGGARSG